MLLSKATYSAFRLYIFLSVYFCDMNYSLQKFGVSKIFIIIIIIISKNTFS